MSFFDIFKNKNKSSSNEEPFNDAYILALVHRLRTPLNGARWALDSVIKSEDKEESKKILNEGYNKIIDAINTVNEILKVAEVDSKDGQFNLNKEKINLCVLVDDILKNLDFLIKKKEITLEYDKKCDPVPVYGDPYVLCLGLTNIFDNAFRYSPKGKVNIIISKEGNMAKLVIKDNGVGISEEDSKHLFEKFYRGKNAKMIDKNESGVGLYSTKKIIDIHEGIITLNSEENKGTTVEVKLPID